MSGVAILSPGYPEQLGGVRDHTQRLATRWHTLGVSVSVEGCTARAPGALVNDLSAGGCTALLIQYVPFLYARRGLSLYPERVARAARAAGLRVVVFVHEPWVPPSRLPWLILSPLQQRQLRRLVAIAHEVVTPVPAWRDLLSPRTRLLYVGSTLGEPPTGTAPRLESPVVFSITAAGFLVDWVAEAARAIGSRPELVVVGSPAPDTARHVGWEWKGRLPASEVLDALAGARLVLAPYVDGASGRRTALLAALSTGARVVTTRGPLFDPVFEGELTVARLREEFVAGAIRVWREADSAPARERRRVWYRKHFDPKTLDWQLLDLLRGTPG